MGFFCFLTKKIWGFRINTVNFAHHSNNPNVGLPAHMDYAQYKMFMGDTGLLVTLAFWDKDVTENVIYQNKETILLPVFMTMFL